MKPTFFLLAFSLSILFTLNLSSQTSYFVDFGFGMSTSQLKSTSLYNETFRGYKSPSVGIYTGVLLGDRIKLETGIEMLSTGVVSSWGYYDEFQGINHKYKTTTLLKKLNTPLNIGIDFQLNKFRLSPYIGANFNYNLDYSNKDETIITGNNVTKRSVDDFDMYDSHIEYMNELVEIQAVMGIGFVYLDKLRLDISWAKGRNFNTYYYDSYPDFMFCGIYPSQWLKNNDIKIVLKYSIFRS